MFNLQNNLFLDYVLGEGDDGDLLWRDASPDLALRDTLGVDGFLSAVEDKWKVMVSWEGRKTHKNNKNINNSSLFAYRNCALCCSGIRGNITVITFPRNVLAIP